MLRSLFFLLVLSLLFSCSKGTSHVDPMIAEAGGHVGAYSSVKFSSDFDPVCKMSLLQGIADTVVLDSKVLGFCTDDCRKRFRAQPSLYGF